MSTILIEKMSKTRNKSRKKCQNTSISSWKNDKKALLIDGARQVGKTYIIRRVLESEGCDYIEFNLIQSPEIVLPVCNVTEPTIPLMLSEKRSLFKLFLSDTGMLTTLYGKATKMHLLSGNPDVNYGALYENVVAQELKTHGFTLYYYNSKKKRELDFAVEYKGKVLPIEVKSGKDYQRHSALSNIIETSDYLIDEAFVLSNFNVEIKGKIVYYPIYMLMFINEENIEIPKIEIEDLSVI